MTESGKLRVALVGCGSIARAHWRGIRERVPQIEVTAVVDPNRPPAQTLARRIGCRAYDSLDEALAERGDRFDAVDIMVPHHLHEELAKAALKAGKHVCLEKPIAHDLKAAKRILAAAKRADKKARTVLMVAEQAQYWPDVIRAAELIQAGAIGRVVGARACYRDWFGDHDVALGSLDHGNWRLSLEAAGGGICIDGAAHWIRPLRMMLGEIEQVMAVTGRHVEAMEGESHANALFRFEGGVIASFEAFASAGATGPTEDWRVTGTEGEIVIEHRFGGRMMLYNAEHPDGQVLFDDVGPGKAESYGAELDDFANAVLHGTPLAAPPEYALGELRTALAMYRSSESGQWEDV